MDIDCISTDEIVCPHCGHEHTESYEFFDSCDDTEITCGECERDFVACREVAAVSYSTMVKP